MTRSKTSRRGSVVALACTALIGFASVVAQPASADPASDPLPTFDFADCPSIPAGADPGLWRCEVLMSSGTFRFGDLPEQPTGAMRMTFAEGQLDGKFAQVFGALRADPTPVPGGLLGIPATDAHNPKLRLDLRIEYAGYSDFLSVGDRMGEQHLKLRVISPLLPGTCAIGSDDDPIKFKPVRIGRPEVISTDPQVLKFTIEDKEFAVPEARGCGGLDRLVNRRFGLPAPAGANRMTFTTLVGLKSYTQL
ncbi:hypothetical protein F4560_001317 [Saccharothrix ecbatanensis]|uniref:Secreted protein n=1 Tax=Saccharothrix ecbatanensis TaxID=1105145 RepID=A0A7W9HGH1_9PSEU|nr:hypothetical protein [Saccharothrix ecbatanensis]MBB5801549.1 hypothetical protein [Saccharothrix ecbatanensis]